MFLMQQLEDIYTAKKVFLCLQPADKPYNHLSFDSKSLADFCTLCFIVIVFCGINRIADDGDMRVISKDPFASLFGTGEPVCHQKINKWLKQVMLP